jgi:uncharacterized membrane protein YphA (DoxX/SURF4 family)
VPPAPSSTSTPPTEASVEAARESSLDGPRPRRNRGARWRPWRPCASGPNVARTFHALLGGIQILAWISLALQLDLLIGSHGLAPLADFLVAARAQVGGLPAWRFPSLLALLPGDAGPGDITLLGGPILGVALGLGSLLGRLPRACAAGQVVLYLGYATACRNFLGFQWDNLLLECSLLAAFTATSTSTPSSTSWSRAISPLVHVLFRLLVFKLYFESGLAKWQSPIHDWRDGTAMTFYYETAPLPTALGWYAHHLPRAWHLLESRAVLAIELVAPLAIFGPRPARLTAAALFTVFQGANAATANYGFFCFLAVALHVFLLDDRDLGALTARARRLVARLAPGSPRARMANARPGAAVQPPSTEARAPSVSASATVAVPVAVVSHPTWRRTLAWAGAAAWVAASLAEGAFAFGDLGPGAVSSLIPVLELTQTFRVVNAYHLFASVTRQRIEPEIQTEDDGRWSSHDLRYKPGDLRRRPPFVAPHQPRVDFLLWFFGLSYDRSTAPAYVTTLLERLCDEPATVAPLFAGPLPAAPTAVRIAFFEYHFSSASQKATTGAWWSREPIGVSRSLSCGR